MFRLQQFPQSIDIELYNGVENAEELGSKLRQGQLDCALIDASCVASLDHLMTAIYRALLDSNSGNRQTKNVHSEILYCMSPSKNITGAFVRFGIKPDSKAMYVVRIRDSSEQLVAEEPVPVVGGTKLDLTQQNIKKLSSIDTVKKIYKTQDQSLIAAAICLRGH